LFILPASLFVSAQSKEGQDEKFFQEAVVNSMVGVSLGKIAQTNGVSKQVKTLAKIMIEDHSRANQELMDLARKANWKPPIAMDAAAQAKVDRLSHIKGDEFDYVYLKEMEVDHKRDIQEFQKEVKEGGNANLKSWAAKKVSMLESHFEQIEDAANNRKSGEKGNDNTSKGDGPAKQ